MRNLIWVFLGGGMGSVARWWVSGVIARLWGEAFPFGTLLVNVTGSFAAGLLGAMAVPSGRGALSIQGYQFLMIGVCGGYTTFSAFSFQTIKLIEEGSWFRAGGYVALSVVLCLVAAALGYACGRHAVGGGQA